MDDMTRPVIRIQTPAEILQRNWIGYCTIVRKEVRRFMRIWMQTVFPPVITTSLYFLIFGTLIGKRIGTMGGYPYLDYIVPGLILMAIITNAYSNVSSSFYSTKFQRHIEEMLVSPLPNWIIVAGYVTGGVARGLAVALVVTSVALVFANVQVQHPAFALLVVILTATLFALAGFINAMLARNFDDVTIVPTFILTPLTYLGGVFYSIDLLPDLWRNLSFANPILYMVNAMRFSVLGVSDFPIATSLILMVLFIIAFAWISVQLMNRGIGIKS
jgi:ABC-2 type transport system permease protein